MHKRHRAPCSIVHVSEHALPPVLAWKIRDSIFLGHWIGRIVSDNQRDVMPATLKEIAQLNEESRAPASPDKMGQQS
jgi:hypothetical protein